MMFGAGALVASGALPFWPICAWAIAGAILGDGLSYWAGHRYRRHVAAFWPFRSHPGLLARGEDFFRRHGAKSILLGRFVGPIRPVIPIVAGMLGMPAVPFYLTNIVSAFAWAPAYLLPGMAFGASLALAGAVAGRLALLLSVLIVGSWVLVVLIRGTYRWSSHHARRWGAVAASWAREHPRLRWLLGDLLDPERPPSRGLTLWVFLLLGGAWLFFGVLEDVLTVDPLVRVDRSVEQFLAGLRGPFADSLMAAASELGDVAMLLAVVGLVTLWLLRRRAWRDLGYLLAGLAFSGLAVAALKHILQVARPAGVGASIHGYSFPSGHATMSLVVYGLLAVLCAAELAPRWRPVPYVVAGLLVAAIAGSRLYLGVHWLSDVVAGLALGISWLALSSVARQRHRHRPLGRGFPFAVAAAVALVGLVHVTSRHGRDLDRYALHAPERALGAADWWDGGWRLLPANRFDLRGLRRQPLDLQWAGDLAEIRRALLAHGWQEPVPLTARTVLRWLQPSPGLASLPLLPHVHDGRYESLALVRAPGDARPRASQLLVLRLWSTNVRLEPGQAPLWIGSIAWLRPRRIVLLTVPVTADEFAQAFRRSRRWFPERCATRAASSGAAPREILLCSSTPPSSAGASKAR